MQIMIGSDALFFSALELGAAGGVLGSANVLPLETSSIFNSFAKGDVSESHKFQQQIDPFTIAMTLGTYPAALKEALRILGYDCGTVRRPLVSLDEEQRKKVRESLFWKLGAGSTKQSK